MNERANPTGGTLPQAVVTTPVKAGPRKVYVRVVDVFGFEAEEVTTVGAA